VPNTGQKVRWGILGVAKINERLIPAFKRAAHAELVAIASRSLDRARQAADADRIPRYFGSYEALLEDRAIDAVYIPLPNSLHAEWTMKSAERGKHVLCEKPLASDAVEAQRCVDFCYRHGVRLMEGFMWPHHPRTAKLRRFLDSGAIGEIRRITSSFTFQLDLNPENIRLQSGLAGGSVMDVGCYPIFGARWVMQSEPTRVYAHAELHQDVDLRMDGVLGFPGGRAALFDCGFTLPFRGDMEIVGRTGVVRVPDMWLPPTRAVFQVLRDNRLTEEHVVEGEDQIVHMIQNFSRAVLAGSETWPEPDQGVATMKVLDALRQSARMQQPVNV
jgi:predicted dehydrogenase